jgi:hypothetical protein
MSNVCGSVGGSRVEKCFRFGRPAEYLDQVDSCQDDGGGCGVCKDCPSRNTKPVLISRVPVVQTEKRMPLRL